MVLFFVLEAFLFILIFIFIGLTLRYCQRFSGLVKSEPHIFASFFFLAIGVVIRASNNLFNYSLAFVYLAHSDQKDQEGFLQWYE